MHYIGGYVCGALIWSTLRKSQLQCSNNDSYISHQKLILITKINIFILMCTNVSKICTVLRRDWLAMRTLQSLTGTLPQVEMSATCVPTLCWGAETQTTRPSSVTSPDSLDGGWYVTGQQKTLRLHYYWLDYDEINTVGGKQYMVCFNEVRYFSFGNVFSSSLDDWRTAFFVS